MSNFSIIGAGGRAVDPADYEADAVIGALELLPDEAVVGQLPMLSSRFPSLPARAATLSPRISQLLRSPALGAATRGALAGAMRGPQVVPTDPGPVGLSSIPFNFASVASGGTATIIVQPQSIFKPYKLVLDEVIRPFFLIQSFTIGTVPLFDAPGAMAGTLFTPDALPNLKKITANPGIAVTMVVVNRDGAAHPFFAAVYGEAAPTQCG